MTGTKMVKEENCHMTTNMPYVRKRTSSPFFLQVAAVQCNTSHKVLKSTFF